MASSAEETTGTINKIAHTGKTIQHLEGKPFARLITSPYNRAQETAEILADVMRMDPKTILEDFRLRDTDSTCPGEPADFF